MQTRAKKIAGLVILISFLFLLTGNQAFAQGLVSCGRGSTECSYNDFLNLINTIISFIAFQLAPIIAVIGIMSAGIMLVLNPTNPGQRSKAKAVFTSIVYGFIYILAAYLIVKLIITGLTAGQDNSGLLKLFK